jgi:hypothetical protein
LIFINLSGPVPQQDVSQSRRLPQLEQGPARAPTVAAPTPPGHAMNRALGTSTKPGRPALAGPLFALLIALTVTPVARASAAAADALPTDAAGLRAAMQSEVGRPTCRASSECRTVPVGHKACGGPEGWLASSSAVGRADRIDALAVALAEARRSEQQASGMMSTCSVLADPGARCRAGVCELQPAPRGPANGGVVR